uniref:Serine/threonine-protein phosphatase 4 regulatory subunit 2 n=1 Tax=Noccaea caerulescens TaxID=107243 RepID=A0A1J3H7H4_NOCCA
MENPSSDHQTPDTSSIPPPIDGELRHDHAVVTQVLEHQIPGAEQKTEMSEEEIKGTLEAIASTGKFWQDWEKLKGMLSCWLKKILSEYPEAKMTDEQQKEALGETYSELVSRLDEALCNFDEGPPFTLQRLCEILLAARTIYPKLSKLALALEKNLLVTSMLSISSTDPQSQTTEDANAATEDTKTAAADWAPNGIEAVGGDKDEIMTEVEEADVDDAMTIDMETIDEPSETVTTASETETPSEITAAIPSSDSVAAEEGDSRLP